MDHNSHKVEALANGEHRTVDTISMEQLQRLVRLLDGSDIAEIEVRREGEGVQKAHLLLRKAKVSTSDEQLMVAGTGMGTPPAAPEETKHTIVALLVGIFHVWARPKGGALVAVGDHVKVDQLVGTIQSLNVHNEVESHVSGRVSEIFVQEGQAVEYGQPLMIIDSSKGA